ncbi:Hypothetical protein FKW44_005942, partial [Caligus rogercresseyi]
HHPLRQCNNAEQQLTSFSTGSPYSLQAYSLLPNPCLHPCQTQPCKWIRGPGTEPLEHKALPKSKGK